MVGKLNILIVDDIFTNRLLLSEIIRDLGHKYKEVENGKTAIEALENDHFDLVLMDIEMPVMNGLETTKYIRTNAPFKLRDIPVIALTAHNPNLFFDDFKDIGFSQLLTKPYSIQKIQNIIADVFENEQPKDKLA
jgi:CheY-like chemotaxis protein